MRIKNICKILSSMPIVLITLYFLPVLGILLLILRFFFFFSHNKKWTSIILVGLGFILLFPKGIDWFSNAFNIEKNSIPYFLEITKSTLYTTKIIEYGKLLLYLGIIFLIVSVVFNLIATKTTIALKKYIQKEEQSNRKISEKNDLIMKEKREKAQNTNYVKCPYCGSDNLVSEKFAICSYCRRKIENKNEGG